MAIRRIAIAFNNKLTRTSPMKHQ